MSWSLLWGWNLQAADLNPDASKKNVIFRLQFQGDNHFAQTTNAATFKTIWNLPSTKTLLDLFLDKLARATIRFYPSIPEQEHPALLALVRPLLDDFLKWESCLELRGPTNQVHWLAAIQSDTSTANRWSQQIKQLAAKLSLNKFNILSGPEAKGWVASSEKTEFSLKFTRTKSWIAVMGGPNLSECFSDVDGRLAALDAPGPDLKDQLALVSMDPAPAAFWLPALAWVGIPPFELIAQEDGPNIRTTLKLTFAEPQPMDLEAWDIPYSAIRNPQNSLASFQAVRGIREWLHKIKGFSDMNPDMLPNQFISWGQSQFGGLTFITAPVADLTNTINNLAYKVPNWISDTFTNSYTKIYWASNAAELVWQGLPMMTPFIKPLHSDGKDYLSVGLIPLLGSTNPPTPTELFSELKKPDLFYYGWEITQQRLLHYRHYFQFGLIVDNRQAMKTNEMTFHWIQEIYKNLGNTITIGTRESPTQLNFERKSHLGLTGAEIVFLTQWLRSENFPYSYTFSDPLILPSELQKKPKPAEDPTLRNRNSATRPQR